MTVVCRGIGLSGPQHRSANSRRGLGAVAGGRLPTATSDSSKTIKLCPERQLLAECFPAACACCVECRHGNTSWYSLAPSLMVEAPASGPGKRLGKNRNEDREKKRKKRKRQRERDTETHKHGKDRGERAEAREEKKKH